MNCNEFKEKISLFLSSIKHFISKIQWLHRFHAYNIDLQTWMGCTYCIVVKEWLSHEKWKRWIEIQTYIEIYKGYKLPYLAQCPHNIYTINTYSTSYHIAL